LQQFQETGSVLQKKGAGRPSVHADTADMFREECKLSRYPWLISSPTQPNVFFQQDGVPPHCGLTVRQSLNTTFRNKCIWWVGTIPWPAHPPNIYSHWIFSFGDL
jgi:hypothetical protein